ncbi:MAG: hypothetical protein QM478_03295 [Flavobacteriaceae bacterium]
MMKNEFVSRNVIKSVDVVKSVDVIKSAAVVTGVNETKSNDDTPFWTITVNGKGQINQSKLIEFLQEAGFYKITTKNGKSVVRVKDNIVEDALDHDMVDHITQYLRAKNEMEILELFSRGVSNYINSSKLNLLDTVVIPIDRDPKDESCFYFKNTAVKVSKNGIELVKYEDLQHKIWSNRIIGRDFNPSNGAKSDFQSFLFNLAGQKEERYEALISIIGYLLHRYQNKSITKAVILVDENISFDGQANGGTGKTLITEAVGKMRELVGIDGKNIKTKSWFKNQRITKTTDVLRYDDVQRNFSLESLYSMITSGIPVEQKYKDEFYISPDDAPKIVISSNYPVKGTGGATDRRRRCEFEVANHYNSDYQPIDDFGKHFFDDWNDKQWNDFDELMMTCASVYLEKGLIIPEPINLIKNRLVNDTCTEFVSYVNEFVEMNEWIDKREHHAEFMEKFPLHNMVTSHQFTKWLKEYASQNNLIFEDKSSGGKYTFILVTTESSQNEK